MRGERGAYLILWPWGWALIWERALIRPSLATNETFLFTMFMCSFSFLFLKSKNKKAAALPFVLAAPLDPEKGMDSNYSRTPVTSSVC